MIYIYIIILILSTILYFVIKDKSYFYKLSSVINISSFILNLILSYTINFLISKNIPYFNTTKIESFLSSNIILKSIPLLILGIIYYLIYLYFKKKYSWHIIFNLI